jgi:cytidylate kinase
VQARGQEADFEPVLASMRRRDEIDSHRDVSPLRVAEDARILDTTGLAIEEVLTAAERILEACGCLEG